MYNIYDPMKTFIIQLESHDDLDSARDKLKGAKARRAIFVWPKSGKAVSDYFSLSLLQREAERQGVAISFISNHAEVRENAGLLGIPIFQSLSQAERSTWKTPPKRHIDRRAPLGYQNLVVERDRLHPIRKSSRVHEFGQAALFLVSILSLVGLVLFFIPSAEVRISQQKVEQVVSFDIRVDTKANAINLAGTIPGKVVTLELSGSKSGTSTGQTQVGAEPAAGVLLVTNYSGTVIEIPRGTTFITGSNEGLTFQTIEDAHLAADGSQAAEVKVIANQAGIEGNLAPGETFSPQLAWAASVTASNPEAFTGGSSVESPSPTPEDLSQTRDALVEELKQQAGATLLTGRPEGTVLIPQSLGGTVVSEVHSAEPGQPADHFSVEVKMTFTATLYLQADVNELAQSILDANLAADMQSVRNSLGITPISEYSDQSGNFGYKVTARRLIEERISTDELSQTLVRMPLDQARDYLDSHLKLEKGSEITLAPRWWKNMPFVSFRIKIEEQ